MAESTRPAAIVWLPPTTWSVLFSVPSPTVSTSAAAGAIVYALALLKEMLPIVRLASRVTVRGAVIAAPKTAVSPAALGALGVQLAPVVQLPLASTFQLATRPESAIESVTKPPEVPNV